METVNYSIVAYSFNSPQVGTSTWIWPEDTCDCDERCSKCGKKKKNRYTYPTVTYTGCCTKC